MACQTPLGTRPQLGEDELRGQVTLSGQQHRAHRLHVTSF